MINVALITNDYSADGVLFRAVIDLSHCLDVLSKRTQVHVKVRHKVEAKSNAEAQLQLIVFHGLLIQLHNVGGLLKRQDSICSIRNNSRIAILIKAKLAPFADQSDDFAKGTAAHILVKVFVLTADPLVKIVELIVDLLVRHFAHSVLIAQDSHGLTLLPVALNLFFFVVL